MSGRFGAVLVVIAVGVSLASCGGSDGGTSAQSCEEARAQMGAAVQEGWDFLDSRESTAEALQVDYPDRLDRDSDDALRRQVAEAWQPRISALGDLRAEVRAQCGDEGSWKFAGEEEVTRLLAAYDDRVRENEADVLALARKGVALDNKANNEQRAAECDRSLIEAPNARETLSFVQLLSLASCPGLSEQNKIDVITAAHADRRVVEVLTNDESVFVRTAAALSGYLSVDTLGEMASDPEGAVREAVAKTLPVRKDSAPIFRKLSNDPLHEVHISLIYRLMDCADSKGCEIRPLARDVMDKLCPTLTVVDGETLNERCSRY